MYSEVNRVCITGSGQIREMILNLRRAVRGAACLFRLENGRELGFRVIG